MSQIAKEGTAVFPDSLWSVEAVVPAPAEDNGGILIGFPQLDEFTGEARHEWLNVHNDSEKKSATNAWKPGGRKDSLGILPPQDMITGKPDGQPGHCGCLFIPMDLERGRVPGDWAGMHKCIDGREIHIISKCSGPRGGRLLHCIIPASPLFILLFPETNPDLWAVRSAGAGSFLRCRENCITYLPVAGPRAGNAYITKVCKRMGNTYSY